MLASISDIVADYETVRFYGEPSRPSTEPEEIRCKFTDCSAKFPTAENLKTHIEVVHGISEGHRCNCGGLYFNEFFANECVSRH